jgi:hypothetical protein
MTKKLVHKHRNSLKKLTDYGKTYGTLVLPHCVFLFFDTLKRVNFAKIQRKIHQFREPIWSKLCGMMAPGVTSQNKAL